MAELPVESSSDAISWDRINSLENHFSVVDFDFFHPDLPEFNFSALPPTNVSPPSVPLEDITSSVIATTSPLLNDLSYPSHENYRNSLQSSLSSFGKLKVFWSHDDSHPIKRKVRCAFGSLQVDDSFGGLIQFWALVQTDGRNFLTTSSQPFTLATLNNSLDRYLSCSYEYKCNLDVMGNLRVKDEPTILSSYVAPARAFLNQKPELVPDLRFPLTNPNPLVSSALMCGLMHSVLLPIFYPSQSDCVGVVECSMKSPKEVLQVFNKLNTALEKEDLRTFDARKLLPYDTIQGLRPARDEINEALKTVWHSHHLVFAHVWIGYDDGNLSFLRDGQAKQIWGLKLTNSSESENLGNEDFVRHQKHLEDYNNACYRLPLKMDEVLAGMIFKKYEPHFIKNILNLGVSKPKRLFSICLDYSCFVIYLRSNKTDDLDYVFQFLWSQSRNNVIMLESLLLTLKRCLPSFKFDSGAEFGDEINIVDVENFTESEIKYLKIFQRNKISLKRGRQLEDENCLTHSKGKGKTTPKIFSRSQIEVLYGQTRKDAAKELGTCVSTLQKNCNRLGLKWPRKGYSKESQSDVNEEDEGRAIQRNIGETPLEGNILKIKVEYAGDVIMVILPISSTFADIEKEIGKKLKLDPAVRYKLDYLDNENEWILLACDEDLKVCTNISRKVRLRLLSRHPS